MGWGDAAKEALVAAKGAFERVVRLEAMIISIKEAVESFERRIESSVHRQSESTREELRNFDARLRDIERQLSKTEAKVDGALAEAFCVAVQSTSLKKRAELLGLSPKLPEKEPNGRK